jgi:hypothetical protein
MAICPEKVVVFQICNSNAVRDDNFEIQLNGNVIGNVDLNANALVGSVFIASTNTNLTITGADFVCPTSAMVKYFFDESIIIDGINTIYMRNTQANRTGNQGTIGVRVYDIVGNTLSNPITVADVGYSPPNGRDFTTTFVFACPNTSTTTNTTNTTCNPCWLQPPDTNIPINPPISLTTQNPTNDIVIYTTIGPNVNVLSPDKVGLFTQTTTQTTQIPTSTLNPFTSTSTNTPLSELFTDCAPIIWRGNLNF